MYFGGLGSGFLIGSMVFTSFNVVSFFFHIQWNAVQGCDLCQLCFSQIFQENAVFVRVASHKFHFRHPDLLRVGDSQARLSRRPKARQGKTLTTIKDILIHPHPSCSFFSSFTIRSRFFAVFMNVGR